VGLAGVVYRLWWLYGRMRLGPGRWEPGEANPEADYLALRPRPVSTVRNEELEQLSLDYLRPQAPYTVLV